MSAVTLALVGVIVGGLQADGYRHVSPLADEVQVRLSADRETYYRGERLRLTVTAVNVSDQPVTAFLDIDPLVREGRLFYGRAGTPLTELTALRADGQYVEKRRTLPPGGTHVVQADLTVTGYARGDRRFLLDTVGRYEFKLKYGDTSSTDANGFIESEPLVVEVVEAPTEERAAQDAYTPDLAYVAQFQRARTRLTLEETRAAVDFIQRFPGSRYAVAVKEGLRGWLSFQNWLPGRATDEERRLWTTLFKDHTRPQLTAVASPGRLWPPNNKMVPISVAVSVRDDHDPNPTVRLVSITCNDGCDLTADIGNVAVDTDDRMFELRAARQGAGRGRTYTITYSASDSSGNTAQTSAEVIVPHDVDRK